MQVRTLPEEPLVVQVGGRLVEGWIMEPACASCGSSRVYFLAYDASCCPSCNEWLELFCPAPECVHCLLRPERPWEQEDQGASGLTGPWALSERATSPIPPASMTRISSVSNSVVGRK